MADLFIRLREQVPVHGQGDKRENGERSDRHHDIEGLHSCHSSGLLLMAHTRLELHIEIGVSRFLDEVFSQIPSPFRIGDQFLKHKIGQSRVLHQRIEIRRDSRAQEVERKKKKRPVDGAFRMNRSRFAAISRRGAAAISRCGLLRTLASRATRGRNAWSSCRSRAVRGNSRCQLRFWTGPCGGL